MRAEAAPFFVDGRLADQPHGVFVACDADHPDRLLGFIEVSLSGVDTPSDHDAAHVEAWSTVPAARRRGVGAALMRAGEDWARSMGRHALTSDTTPAEYPHSTAAHRAAGFIVERVTIGEKKTRWFWRGLD